MEELFVGKNNTQVTCDEVLSVRLTQSLRKSRPTTFSDCNSVLPDLSTHVTLSYCLLMSLCLLCSCHSLPHCLLIATNVAWSFIRTCRWSYLSYLVSLLP